MKKISITANWIFIASVSMLVACSRIPSPDHSVAAYAPDIDGNAVQAHVALLADDLYEGREAGKRGYQLAAKYVATQFRAMGLAPGNAGARPNRKKNDKRERPIEAILMVRFVGSSPWANGGR